MRLFRSGNISAGRPAQEKPEADLRSPIVILRLHSKTGCITIIGMTAWLLFDAS
jgi:hypothetical protein